MSEKYTEHPLRWRFAATIGAFALLLHVPSDATGASGDTCSYVPSSTHGAEGQEVALAAAHDAARSVEGLTGHLQEVYDVPVDIVDEDVDEQRAALTALDPVLHRIALGDVASTLSYFPPELVQYVDLDALRIVNSIELPDGRHPGGVYFGSVNEIVVRGNHSEYLQHVMAHELMHALDARVFCDEGDRVEWQALSGELYGRNNSSEDVVEARHMLPHPERHFASHYGATSVLEDRATMLESVLFRRGLVREGDPDDGSVYHQKQELLVAQLERVAPGMRSMLEARTPELRERARELLISVPSPHKPGEMTSPRAAIAHAYLHDLPVEQLVDTIIAIERDGQSTIWVQHPVVLRNMSGDLAGFVWTEYDEKGGVRIAHSYFDRTSMTVMNFSDAQSVWGKAEATLPDRGGFMRSGLSVGGVQAERMSGE